ncbi:Bug family tripartite tricarboxylate transporter substrate binding protein [Bordetella bronchialis]|nr:tripartite tricarboxylate transporter substrate binding protein [Bordetella bronchialis]
MYRLKSMLSGLACVMAAMSPAMAQAYPDHPITLVVGFPPGGGVDLVARPLAERLSKQLGQPVIVENRGGAAGNIAMDYVARSRPDGYTLMMGNLGMLSANPLLYPNLNFNVSKSFAPVARLVVTPLLAAVPARLPATDMKQFVALAKQEPGKMFFGSGGTGNINHLAVELLKLQTGAQITHVPYKGSAPALTALVANEVQLVIDGFNIVLPQVKGGMARALAVTGEKRAPSLPDVPTMKEAGYPGMTIYGWQGLFVPAGTPQPIVDRLTDEVDKALKDPALSKRLADQGTDPAFQNAADFQKYIAAEQERWGKVIQTANIKVE